MVRNRKKVINVILVCLENSPVTVTMHSVILMIQLSSQKVNSTQQLESRCDSIPLFTVQDWIGVVGINRQTKAQ